jgi:hypothetical protein
MNVLNSCNKLWEDSHWFSLIDSFILYNIVKQFSFLHVLHYKEQLLGCFNDFIKLHYIGVPDEF